MSRSSLYLVIAILTAAIVAIGLYIAYQQSRQPGLEIRINEQGISVDGNG